MKNLLPVLIAVYLWGIHGPAGRYLALEGISMPFVTVSRFYIGTMCIFSYLVFTKTFSNQFWKLYKNLLPIGIIGIACNSIVYHLGFSYVPATVAMLLENLSPFFVLFLVYFVDKEKVTAWQIFSGLVSFVGLVFVILGKGGVDTTSNSYIYGIILELLAGLTFGLYTWMSGRFLTRHQNALIASGLTHTSVILNLLFHVFLIASLCMTPLFFMKGNLPHRFPHVFWILEMGIFQSGVAYILWNTAIAKLRSGVTSLFFFLTVFFTMLNEIIFLDFRPNLNIICGCTFILIGVGILLLEKISRKTCQAQEVSI